MPNQQIINYIQTQLQSGVAIERVKIALLQSGWKQQDVDAAISQAQPRKAGQTPTIQPIQPITPPQKAPVAENEIPAEMRSFVEKNLQAGQSKVSIAASLKIAGWDENLINKALGQQVPSTPIATVPEKVKKVEKRKGQRKVIEKTKEESIPTDRKIDLAENFTLTIKLIGTNFLTIIGIQFLPTVLSIIALSLFSVIGNFESVATATIVAIISATVFAILGVWSQTALIYSIARKEKNVLKSYGNSLKRVFPSLITVLTLTGVLITGSVLFLIPLFIFGVWFIFSPFVTVNEELKGAKALAKSRNYVRDNFWMIFARVLLIGLFTIILIGLLSALTNILFPEPSILKYTWTVLQSAFQLGIATFAVVFIYVLFENIKGTKKEVKDTKKSFIWVIRIMSWLGCGGILVIIGLGIFLIGAAAWTVFQELSATGELSLEMIRELFR